MIDFRTGPAAAIVLLLGLASVAGNDISYQTLVMPLLESGKTVIGDAMPNAAASPK